MVVEVSNCKRGHVLSRGKPEFRAPEQSKTWVTKQSQDIGDSCLVSPPVVTAECIFDL